MVSAAAGVMLLLAAPAAVAGDHKGDGPPGDRVGDPPGNNGTVKIDGEPFDTHPDNEPHVGCVFQIDFYGYDEIAEPATAVFTAQSPTGSGEELARHSVAHGEDPHDGGGSEAGLDAELTVDLTSALASYEPHPQQGYHVKLTVHAPGSQGADTKHKVFWVEPCGGEVASSSDERRGEVANRVAERRAMGFDRAAQAHGAKRAGNAFPAGRPSAAEAATVERTRGQVLGVVHERALAEATTVATDTGVVGTADQDRARVLGLSLARTGTGLAALAALAVALILAGTALAKPDRLRALRGRR